MIKGVGNNSLTISFFDLPGLFNNGISTSKVVPLPSLLLTWIVPATPSTLPFIEASPIPVPLSSSASVSPEAKIRSLISRPLRMAVSLTIPLCLALLNIFALSIPKP